MKLFNHSIGWLRFYAKSQWKRKINLYSRKISSKTYLPVYKIMCRRHHRIEAISSPLLPTIMQTTKIIFGFPKDVLC